ncbi:MAG TPA: response regulator [Acidimicrobiales bacterium]|nr:response regulator [Acidimicrobiales bacterium]
MRLRCLIVDDNADFLLAARELLEGDGLDVVDVATTGDKAVARAEELRPDVILVDVYLARESGFELADRLAASASQRSSVILISTYAERDLSELVTASPAVGFLTKGELSGHAIRATLGITGSPGR